MIIALESYHKATEFRVIKKKKTNMLLGTKVVKMRV